MVPMSTLRVCTGMLVSSNQQGINAQRTIHNSISALQGLKNLPLTMSSNMHMQLRSMIKEAEAIQRKLVQIDGFVKDSGYAYEQMEQQLNTQAETISQQSEYNITDLMSASNALIKNIAQQNVLQKAKREAAISNTAAKAASFASALFPKGNSKTSASSSSSSTSSQYGKWNVNAIDTYHDATHNVNSHRTLRSLISDGIKAKGEMGIHLFNISRTDKAFGMLHRAELNVGNAEISGKAHGVLVQNGKFNPELDVEVNAVASAAQGMISSTWHNDLIRLKGVMKGEVGVASAKATAKINHDGIDLKAEAGVAAARGEASGSFEFLGFTITGTLKGEAGALGIGGNLSTTDRSFQVGGKLSCLFGTGFDVKVEW